MNDPARESTAHVAYRSQYARLARRITGAASNLLATGVVLAAALGGGRELISWWGVQGKTAAAPAAAFTETWGGDDASRLLEFGDAPYVWRRDAVVGDVQAALAHLRRLGRDALERGAVAAQDVGPAERELLEATRSWTPTEVRTGEWRLYENAEHMPLMIGVRDASPRRASATEDPPSRLVVWGIAVPQAENAWATYFCCGAGHLSEIPRRARPPLPPGSERTLYLAAPGGGALLGFRGGDVLDARSFYESWIEQHGWRVLEPWRHAGGVWRLRAMTANGQPDNGITIHLAVDETRTLRGLIVIEPLQASGGADS